MDNQDKKTTRKTHDINSQFEEENLWDLEDDWDGADEETADETADEALEETPEESEDTSDDEPTETDEAEIEDEVELQIEAEELEGEEIELEQDRLELDEEIDERPELHEPVEDELEIDDIDSPPEIADEDGSEPEPLVESEPATVVPPVEAPSDIEKPSLPVKKWALSGAEKIALTAIAIAFISITLWGVIWLKQKNNQSVSADQLELPLKGTQAIVSDFTTFWKAPGKAPGIKLGAVIVPAASITLDEESSTGALRIYFKSAKGDRVGDTITVNFTNGKFENGTDTIEVSASDGFHLKGDFHAYQMDSSMAWTITLLEASDRSAKSSDFKPLAETRMSPTMR